MSRQPTGPPPPPAVQRLRVRYAKRDRLRFTSHRDFARAFERALRRAAIPMAYSAGFSPHPKVSYAGAAPTGVASEAEYLEIALAERRDPGQVRAALDAALPRGLDVVAVVEAPPAHPALADRLAASHWRIRLEAVEPASARRALETFLALSTAPVERVTKDGRRTLDARAVILQAAVTDSGASQRDSADGSMPCATIDLVIRHTTPAVRPDDVLTALRTVAALTTPVTPMVSRLAQGLPDDASTGDAMRLRDPLGEPGDPSPHPNPDAAVAAPDQRTPGSSSTAG